MSRSRSRTNAGAFRRARWASFLPPSSSAAQTEVVSVSDYSSAARRSKQAAEYFASVTFQEKDASSRLTCRCCPSRRSEATEPRRREVVAPPQDPARLRDVAVHRAGHLAVQLRRADRAHRPVETVLGDDPDSAGGDSARLFGLLPTGERPQRTHPAR